MRRSVLCLAKDLYGILGVKKTVTDAELKQAYKKKAAQLHPDVSKSKNADAEFAELNDAYETLKCPKKRGFYQHTGSKASSEQDLKGYDDFMKSQASQQEAQRRFAERMRAQQQAEAQYHQQRSQAFHDGPFPGGGHPGGGDPFHRMDHNPWGDDNPYEQAFYAHGGTGHPGEGEWYTTGEGDEVEFEGRSWGYDTPPSGRKGQRGGGAPGGAPASAKPQKGADASLNLDLSLDEALHGLSRLVTYKVDKACFVCKGKGSSQDKETCQRCGGYGAYALQFSPSNVTKVTCEECNGSGRKSKPCGKCKGKKALSAETTLSVGIPAGVASGAVLRVVGEGSVGTAGGSSGDLLLKLTVHSGHKRFVRSGDGTLHTTVIVPLAKALFGGTVQTAGLRGETIDVQVPPNTQHLSSLTLEARGAYTYEKSEIRIDLSKDQKEQQTPGKFGKIVVHFVVTQPPLAHLNQAQKDALQSLPDLGASSAASKKVEADAMVFVRSRHKPEKVVVREKEEKPSSSSQSSQSSQKVSKKQQKKHQQQQKQQKQRHQGRHRRMSSAEFYHDF